MDCLQRHLDGEFKASRKTRMPMSMSRELLGDSDTCR
jgi:hypothetical protein